MADDNNSKASQDLEQAKEAVEKVARAEAQIRDLLGESEGTVAQPEPQDVSGAAQGIGAEQGDAGQPAQAAPQVQPQAQPQGQTQVQPTTAYYAPQAQQPMQPSAQNSYWRGFQPVPPAQPVQPIQPQPAYVQQAPVQPAQPAQPTQPTQQVQPAQPVYNRAAQPQPVAYGQQPVYSQPQVAANQAQAAGYTQAYTPQIQQPAGYVPAQDFTVQPQPTTPAYTKANKSALGIVIAVVVGIVAIIAAIILGRILSGTSDNQSPLIDQLSSIEDEYGLDNDGYYNDHDWGNNGNGNGYGDDYDDNWGFSWDDDNWDMDQNTQGHGATHIYGGGIDADDGELHDAWDKSVNYTYTEAEFDKEGIEHIDFYGRTVAYDFDIEYPQLSGDIPNLDAINAAIKDKAMRFVDSTYTNPTSDARAMLETYAGDTYGVPSGVDAILESDVDYAIAYNTDEFISICFSDEYAIGSWFGSSISLRALNINLKTGEMYELDDVLQLNNDIAEDFIENLSIYDEGAAATAAGHSSFVGAIQGKGSDAGNVTPTFFVDGNGNVNLGVSYFLNNGEVVARGWWDYTLTAEQLEAAKKDSDMWDVLAKG